MGGDAGGANGVSGSLFRVGDNVELWRVLAYLSLLVACVVLLEQLLHLLKHKLSKYPKYLEMVNKVFGGTSVLSCGHTAAPIVMQALLKSSIIEYY